MGNRTYRVLLRVYTPKPEEVADRVDRAVAHMRHILAVRKEFPQLQRIAILVPQDYDCGQTAPALTERLTSAWAASIDIIVPHGHHSCEVLNKGIEGLQGEGTTHVLIISGKALSYLTPAAMRGIDQAFADGGLVAGVATDELRDIVLDGRLQNTFAAWDIDALLGVGGFDSSKGVEEIAPIARLVKKYGRCIAPLDSAGGKLDIAPSETARARHAEVMATKLARQLAECERVGSSFDEIRVGIMPGYPRHV